MVEHSTMYQKYGDTEIVMGENAMKKRALVRLIAIMMISGLLSDGKNRSRWSCICFYL